MKYPTLILMERLEELLTLYENKNITYTDFVFYSNQLKKAIKLLQGE